MKNSCIVKPANFGIEHWAWTLQVDSDTSSGNSVALLVYNCLFLNLVNNTFFSKFCFNSSFGLSMLCLKTDGCTPIFSSSISMRWCKMLKIYSWEFMYIDEIKYKYRVFSVYMYSFHFAMYNSGVRENEKFPSFS